MKLAIPALKPIGSLALSRAVAAHAPDTARSWRDPAIQTADEAEIDESLLQEKENERRGQPRRGTHLMRGEATHDQ
ncbi:MAG: hypothetical protein C4293_17820 [Nitrospiraceae bacterium]